jgi:hypothetical protein
MRTRCKNERDNNQRAAITRYWMWHHGSWLSVRGLGSVIEKIEQWEIDRLIPYARNPRKNDHAVDKIASAIREFGFKVPIIAKSNGAVWQMVRDKRDILLDFDESGKLVSWTNAQKRNPRR